MLQESGWRLYAPAEPLFGMHGTAFLEQDPACDAVQAYEALRH